jgi:hypothetical protein
MREGGSVNLPHPAREDRCVGYSAARAGACSAAVVV